MKKAIRYVAIISALAMAPTVPMQAQDKSDITPEAMNALNYMGKYLRTLKEFQVTADVTSEDVEQDGEKLQYTSTTNILAQLPSKLMVDIDGEQKSRLFLYDGKSFTLYARRAGYYATAPAPDTIGKLIDVVSDKYNIDLPLMDLFLWGGERATTNTITVADDIGPASVNGISCEHYAFRQPGLDWQIWIQLGDHPLPLKLVLTTTTDEARPQHTSTLKWNLAPSYSEDAFVFDPPTDAKKIVFAEDKQAAGSN